MPADHPHAARGESLLGKSLALQGRTADALTLLRHAAETLQARLGDGHHETRLAWQRLQAVQSTPDR